MEKQKIKQTKGITLIALVVTIIVLLILAGISIMMLTGEGGILQNAKEASEATKTATEEEQVKLAVAEALLKGNGTLSKENVGNSLKNQFGADKVTEDTFIGDGPWTFIGEEKNYLINTNGKLEGKNFASRTGLKEGDYINYQPDENSEIYSKITSENTGYFNTIDQIGPQEEINQETLKWRILKIYNNGNIDIIGSPTSKKVVLQSFLGYNNGVFLLNDLCETLYSKKSAGIKARSVKLEDLENYLTDDGKKARSDYANDNNIKYEDSYNYSYEGGKLYYPDIYQYEIYSGVTGTIKTDGIGMSDIYKGYVNGLTNKKFGKAGENGLTLKQTFYMIDVSKENYGEMVDVLNDSNGYWMSSRVVNCTDTNDGYGGRFAISCLNGGKIDGVALVYSGDEKREGLYHFPVRPVVTLNYDVEIKASEGTIDNPHIIEKYK